MKDKKLNRGTTDDWESLVVVVQNDESLKTRVLNRLRALRRMSETRKVSKEITTREMREFRLKKGKKTKT